LADLFSVTAPLMIRCPQGDARIMVECFAHPDGILYFEPFWHQLPAGSGVHLQRGELRGDGPWKVGDCVITVLGCQGTHPQLAAQFAAWQEYLAGDPVEYPSEGAIRAQAGSLGAIL
jgi:hypothetical protein